MIKLVTKKQMIKKKTICFFYLSNINFHKAKSTPYPILILFFSKISLNVGVPIGFFFNSIFCDVTKNNNHHQEDLTKFGYIPYMKVFKK